MMWLHLRCWGCLSRGLCSDSKVRMFNKVKDMYVSKKDLGSLYRTGKKKVLKYKERNNNKITKEVTTTLIKTSLVFSKKVSSNRTLSSEIPRALVMFYLREEKSSQIPRTSEIAVERRLGWWERLHLIVPSCSLFVCLIFQPLTFLRAVPTNW